MQRWRLPESFIAAGNGYHQGAPGSGAERPAALGCGGTVCGRGVGAQRVLPKLTVTEAPRRGALWRLERSGCPVVRAGMWPVPQLEIENVGCVKSVTKDVNYSGISVIVMEVSYLSEGL